MGIVFIRFVNGQYQVCHSYKQILTVLARKRRFFCAEEYASQYKNYCPTYNIIWKTL